MASGHRQTGCVVISMGTARLNPGLARNLQYAALLAAYFLWVWLGISPPLQYSSLTPAFFFNETFLREHWGYAGGMVEYFEALLLQYYQHDWLGAFVTTCLAGLVTLCSSFILRTFRCQSPGPLALVPALLLLTSQVQYDYPWLKLTLAWLVSLAAFIAYKAVPSNRRWMKLFAGLGLGVVVFQLSAGAGLVFFWLAGCHDLLLERYWARALFCWGLGLSIPWAFSRFVYVLSIGDAFQFLLPSSKWSAAGLSAKVMFCYLPVCALVLGIREAMSRRNNKGLAELREKVATQPTEKNKQQGKKAGGGHTTLQTVLKSGSVFGKLGKISLWIQQPLACTLLGAMLVGLLHDQPAKRLATIDYLGQKQKPAELLKVAAHFPDSSPLTVAYVNEALAQTGGLLSDMFRFAQAKDLNLWLSINEQMDSRRFLLASRILCDMGQVNRAERIAIESMEINGYQPLILKQLALISILKGEPAAARIFLNLLNQTVANRDWARNYLQILDQDPKASADAGLEKIRSLMILEDSAGDPSPETLLQQCLRRNRRNRLAFDWLMAHYLLNCQHEKIMENLSRFKEVGYSGLPHHCQEALLMAARVQKVAQLDRLPVSPDLLRRNELFHERFMSYRGDLARAQLGLAKEYGDTYWFYCLFEHSGSYAAHFNR